ncbi:hypothetical protein PENTCL1PPCAC_13599, partial [Pristionchus entomophagus]
FEMDIFAFPDVFLRNLMRTMKIEDRMRLRLVCRAFEQLVAETHAGFFEAGVCSPFSMRTLIICIGDKTFTSVAKPVYNFSQFLQLKNRFFSGISFGTFGFKVCNFQRE